MKAQNFPFTIISDEVTDPHANQEILSVCIRFLDIPAPNEPQIQECFLGFLYLNRANARMISEKILQCISDPSICLDPTNIWGQAYDGAAVMACMDGHFSSWYQEILQLAEKVGVGVIALHYKEEISTDYVCHLFCKSHPRRLFGSSLFADIAL